MPAEENKAVVRRIYEELWDERRLEVADELIAEGGLNYDTGLTPRPFGPEGTKGTVWMVTGAFPDNRHEVEDLFAEGDQVMARVKLTGTHEGSFMGIPPTGRRIEVGEIHVCRLRDGKAIKDRVGRTTSARCASSASSPMPSPPPTRPAPNRYGTDDGRTGAFPASPLRARYPATRPATARTRRRSGPPPCLQRPGRPAPPVRRRDRLDEDLSGDDPAQREGLRRRERRPVRAQASGCGGPDRILRPLRRRRRRRAGAGLRPPGGAGDSPPRPPGR